MSAEMDVQTKSHTLQVPYKGEVPAMTDFVAGRIQLMFATPVNALPFVKEGKLKVLATLSDKRSPLLPETPTWAESGMHELSIVPWAGIFGPQHLPAHITQTLAAALNDILQRPDIASELAKLGFEPSGSSPGALAAYTQSQLKAWHTAIHSAGLNPE